MKIFRNKNIFSKLIMVLVVLLVFSAIVPSNVAYAGVEEVGGKLAKPLIDFILFLADGAVYIMHNAIFGMDMAQFNVDLDSTWFETLIIAVVAIAAVIVIVAAVIALSAYAVPFLIAKLTATAFSAATISSGLIATAVVAGVSGGVVAGSMAHSAWFADEVVLPIYQISPEEIFRGEINLLRANFFEEIAETTTTIFSPGNQMFYEAVGEPEWSISNYCSILNGKIQEYGGNESNYLTSEKLSSLIYSSSGNFYVDWQADGYKYELIITKGNCYCGEDGCLGILNPKITRVGVSEENKTIGYMLKDTVAKWYYTLRNFAIVMMMVILVYIGIRILLCSTAGEKAKYKNMLVDWVVALCLIFVMHYIMAFAMNITNNFIDMFGSVENNKTYVKIIADEDGVIDKIKGNESLTEAVNVDDLILEGQGPNGEDLFQWDARNMMGLVRMTCEEENSDNVLSYIGYVICFVIFVLYTIFFLFTYIRRVLYLAFFTIIAPLVAMTYPLDKIHDGKAQAFDMWLKEYIFNLLIQPVHLLLYTVLISSAFELASTNIVYMLVAIGFLMPAEKFIRKMFGFDKAQTPGFLGGAVGAGIVMNGMSKLLRAGGHSKGKSSSNNIEGNKGKDETDFSDNSKVDPKFLMNGNPEEANKKVESGNTDKFAQKEVEDTEKNKMDALGNNAEIELANKTENNDRDNISERSEGPIPIPPPLPQRETMKSKLKRVRNGTGAALGEMRKQAGERAINYVQSGKPVKSLTKAVGGIALGGTAGLIGLSAGIASGDLGKTGQYAATGVAAGYALGSRRPESKTDWDDVKDAYEIGKYGSIEEYKKAKVKEKTEEFYKNSNNIKAMQQYLNLKDEKETREMLEKHSACIDAGITDYKDLATAIQLQEDPRTKWSEEKAITAAKYYKNAGKKPSKMGVRERSDLEAVYKRQAGKHFQGEENVNNAVKQMIKYVEDFGSTRDKIDKV